MAIQRMILMMTACATLVLSGVTAAIAHPRLVRATPAVGSTVATAPSEITLRFNEKLESAFSSVGVRDAAGNKVDKSDAKLDKGNRAILKVSLQPLTPGVYKVEWQAAGSDMHKVGRLHVCGWQVTRRRPPFAEGAHLARSTDLGACHSLHCNGDGGWRRVLSHVRC